MIKEVEEYKAKKAELERKIGIINELKAQPARAGADHGPGLARAARAALARPHDDERRPRSSSRAGPSTPTRSPTSSRTSTRSRSSRSRRCEDTERAGRRRLQLRRSTSTTRSPSRTPSRRPEGRSRRRRRRPAPRAGDVRVGGQPGGDQDRTGRQTLVRRPGRRAWSSAALLFGLGYWRLLQPMKRARSTAQEAQARRAAEQDPGRAGRQAASCRSSARRCGSSSSSSTSCCASCRRGATPPTCCAGSARSPSRGTSTLKRFTPGQLQRPGVLQRVADRRSASTGTYHNLALFFDRISRFSRIINVEDLQITALPASRGHAHHRARASPPRPSSTRSRSRGAGRRPRRPARPAPPGSAAGAPGAPQRPGGGPSDEAHRQSPRACSLAPGSPLALVGAPARSLAAAAAAAPPAADAAGGGAPTAGAELGDIDQILEGEEEVLSGRRLHLRPRQPPRSLQVAARGAGPARVPRPAPGGHPRPADRRDRAHRDLPHRQAATWPRCVAANQKKSYLLKEGDQLYDGDVVSINRERSGLQADRPGSDRPEAVPRGGQEA